MFSYQSLPANFETNIKISIIFNKLVYKQDAGIRSGPNGPLVWQDCYLQK